MCRRCLARREDIGSKSYGLFFRRRNSEEHSLRAFGRERSRGRDCDFRICTWCHRGSGASEGTPRHFLRQRSCCACGKRGAVAYQCQWRTSQYTLDAKMPFAVLEPLFGEGGSSTESAVRTFRLCASCLSAARRKSKNADASAVGAGSWVCGKRRLQTWSRFRLEHGNAEQWSFRTGKKEMARRKNANDRTEHEDGVRQYETCGPGRDFPGKNIASAAREQSLSCARGGGGRVGEGQERSRWKLMDARSGASGYGDRRSVPLKRTRGRQRRSTKRRKMEEEVACAESTGKWGPKGRKLVSMGSVSFAAADAEGRWHWGTIVVEVALRSMRLKTQSWARLLDTSLAVRRKHGKGPDRMETLIRVTALYSGGRAAMQGRGCTEQRDRKRHPGGSRMVVSKGRDVAPALWTPEVKRLGGVGRG
ncbi:hypothetical protein ERJ75_001770000 [Trypanosoma vivax]|nr:hypothetical protein ERJ75_001770000 [Trypanosoma vivax]